MAVSSTISKDIKTNIHFHTIPLLHMQRRFGLKVAIPYIAGKPGAGKTEITKEMCRVRNWEFISTHFALKPIEELGGIPNFLPIEINGVKKTATDWSMPDIIAELMIVSNKQTQKVKTIIDNKYGPENTWTDEIKAKVELEKQNTDIVVWLFDDLHLAGPAHNAYFYELWTERKLRNYTIPENVVMMAAGNFGSAKAGSKQAFSATINRCALFEIHSDLKQWIEDYALPNNVHPAIISFLSHGTNECFFHEEELTTGPWASPRAWARLSTLMTFKEMWNKNFMKEEALEYDVAAHVGTRAATAFMQHYIVFSKFNIEELFNQKEIKLPDSDIDKHILSYAVLHHMTNKSNFLKYKTKYAEVLITYLQSEYSIGFRMLQDINIYDKIEYSDGAREYFKNLYQVCAKLAPNLITKVVGDIAKAGSNDD